MISLDPVTSHMTRMRHPRVCAWYTVCTDLSGLSVLDESAGWIDLAATGVPPTLKAILDEARWLRLDLAILPPTNQPKSATASPDPAWRSCLPLWHALFLALSL